MYGSPDFTVGGALRQTFDIVGRHAATLLGLTAAFYAVPAAVLSLLPKLGLVLSAGAIQEAAATGEPLPTFAVGGLIAYGLISGVVIFLGSLLATAAVVWTSYEGLRGRPADFPAAAARALRVLPANFAMALLISLAFMLGFLLLVVPGIMLILRWSAALPALVVERAGILGSLGRSRDLTRGHRWAILGFLLVLALIDLVVFGVLGFGGWGLAKSLPGAAGATASQVVNLVSNAVLSTVNGAATAALYFELRRAGDGGLADETAEAFT